MPVRVPLSPDAGTDAPSGSGEAKQVQAIATLLHAAALPPAGWFPLYTLFDGKHSSATRMPVY